MDRDFSRSLQRHESSFRYGPTSECTLNDGLLTISRPNSESQSTTVLDLSDYNVKMSVSSKDDKKHLKVTLFQDRPLVVLKLAPKDPLIQKLKAFCIQQADFKMMYKLQTKLSVDHQDVKIYAGKAGPDAIAQKNTKVMIHMIPRDLGDEGKTSFEVQLRLMKQMESKRVFLPILEVFQYSSYYVVITKFYKGYFLSQIISADKKFTEKQAQSCAKSLLKKLQPLHEKEMLHGDLVPENIFYCSTRTATEVFLVNCHLVQTRDFTPSYCPECEHDSDKFFAPEVFTKSIAEVGTQVDLFSLGALVFRMLVGRSIFATGWKPKAKNGIEFDLLDFAWLKLSVDALNFVQYLMLVDPNNPLRTENVLEQPWIKDKLNDRTQRASVELQLTTVKRLSFGVKHVQKRNKTAIMVRKNTKLLERSDTLDSTNLVLTLQGLKSSFAQSRKSWNEAMETDSPLDSPKLERALSNSQRSFKRADGDDFANVDEKVGDDSPVIPSFNSCAVPILLQSVTAKNSSSLLQGRRASATQHRLEIPEFRRNARFDSVSSIYSDLTQSPDNSALDDEIILMESSKLLNIEREDAHRLRAPSLNDNFLTPNQDRLQQNTGFLNAEDCSGETTPRVDFISTQNPGKFLKSKRALSSIK
eukprot:CAMPEP_0115003576 /NCGR_PEP_ID=MMETSP0216-20121206/18694_1 /TAXON_ID=223996 /ORGANISM="Protocruzia adherens, Strain Boccale" /LENGTH=641 /DNA_ID=CAMNT_0002369409 /DNA_START=26 /DNA_END=1951 /DNA_ORIENTATION=-